MRFHPLFIALAGLAFFNITAPAAIYYVAQNSPSPTPPYTSWNTAATNIQDAINVATNGDEILVTNGVYAYGGLTLPGDTPDRVALTLPLTVQSVNGPWVTIIQGAGATNGPAAVRCAWLTNGASLNGFTLQAGGTVSSGATLAQCGGGVFCVSSGALVSNCIITANTAAQSGGGVFQGSLRDCLVTGNSVPSIIGVGGAAYAVMTSCTVVNNAGYGVLQGTYTNCIIYSNSRGDSESGGTFAYTCISQSESGLGNITANPDLFADEIRLLPGSPCIGAGTSQVSGVDIFGRPWANPPSMGCAEFQSGTLVAKPQIQLLGNPAGFGFNAVVAAQAALNYSWLKDGLPLSNNGRFSGTQTTNLTAAGVSLSDAGNYQIVVSNAVGVVTSQVASLVIHCVSAAGTNPIAPYLTWATAATNIQDAITAASPGDVVLVTNGVYAHGGISMDGVIVNCVSVNKGILVESVNGPNSTVIQGAWDPVSTNGNAAVRCAWLTNNAILSGFTLRGGATRSLASPISSAMEGGGIYCGSTNVLVYNCLIATNYASYSGGGVFA